MRADVRAESAASTSVVEARAPSERDAARDAYLVAATRTSNLPQQRYLYARAARLAHDR